MKKIITFIMLLAVTATAFASEKTVTISRGDGEFSEASTVYYAVKDGIILTMTGGMNNVNYLLANPNTNFTVLSYNYVIKKIVFHCMDDALEGDLDAHYWGPSTITIFANHTHPDNPGTYTTEGFIGTWEGEMTGTELPYLSVGDSTIGSHLIHTPVVGVQAIDIIQHVGGVTGTLRSHEQLGCLVSLSHRGGVSTYI